MTGSSGTNGGTASPSRRGASAAQSSPDVKPSVGAAGGIVEDRATTQRRYDTARKELRDLLDRKRQADRDLATLESQIYKLETQYLEDTQQGGNIVRGFDGYLKGMINSRKGHFNEQDRLFSLSSISFSEGGQSAGGLGGALSANGGSGGGGGGGGVSGSLSQAGGALAHGKLAQALQKKRKGASAAARGRGASVSAGGDGGDDDDDDAGTSDSDASAATSRPPNKRSRVSYAD